MSTWMALKLRPTDPYILNGVDHETMDAGRSSDPPATYFVSHWTAAVQHGDGCDVSDNRAAVLCGGRLPQFGGRLCRRNCVGRDGRGRLFDHIPRRPNEAGGQHARAAQHRNDDRPDRQLGAATPKTLGISAVPFLPRWLGGCRDLAMVRRRTG